MNIEELQESSNKTLKSTLGYTANTPLWSRVPTKDESDQYLGDFMMIIKELKKAN